MGYNRNIPLDWLPLDSAILFGKCISHWRHSTTTAPPYCACPQSVPLRFVHSNICQSNAETLYNIYIYILALKTSSSCIRIISSLFAKNSNPIVTNRKFDWIDLTPFCPMKIRCYTCRIQTENRAFVSNIYIYIYIYIIYIYKRTSYLGKRRTCICTQQTNHNNARCLGLDAECKADLYAVLSHEHCRGKLYHACNPILDHIPYYMIIRTKLSRWRSRMMTCLCVCVCGTDCVLIVLWFYLLLLLSLLLLLLLMMMMIMMITSI